MSAIRMTHSRLRSSEQGMVAIMTTMILIIVISLIVLGFAQLSRRNQREALDRQLSTQAFYAAESGVNDARDLINTAMASGGTVAAKDTCNGGGTGGFYSSLNPVIDSAANVKYSCLLVDPTPSSLRYSDVDTTSVVVPVISANGSNISRVELDWQPKVSGNPLAGCPATTNNVFSPTGSWTCGYGVLRLDLVRTAGVNSAVNLQNLAMTTFAVPFASGGTTSIPYVPGAANANARVGVRCTATSCNLTITGLTFNAYHLRIGSLYRNVALQVKAFNSSGTLLDLQGAQAVIDVTGRAQDILRRIQVHVPLRNNSHNQLSDYGIQTTDSICKRFSVMDGYFDNDPLVNGSSRLCNPAL